MTSDRIGELIEGGDLDDLVRHVDHLCFEEDWDGLVELRDRCRKALERGRQLWPVASLAEYRLALEAPGPWAAAVVVPGAGRFALGPLPEVAAQAHEWAELASHLPATPEATFVAHERVVRGEDLTGDAHVDRTALELPLRLEAWEPEYPAAVYKADEAQFPERPSATAAAGEAATGTAELPAPAPEVDDPDARVALTELAAAWTTESNGRARAVAVAGNALGAVATLVCSGPEPSAHVGLAPVTAEDALAAMAWTAASGGAHGRRRGMATGRFGAWWAATALTVGLDGWPPDPDDLGEALSALGWYRWQPARGPSTGWSLRLAAENPKTGQAWAVEAVDAV
ncbi:MAG TPA: DUF6183 family protein [Acidimicrobiales bacterium]|nr:DUF6183 family protein [Acidimicrobiales bacterium]